MAVGGNGGSVGAVGATTVAATNLAFIDPHIVILMRDVLSNQYIPAPLSSVGGSGGGGGGGGGGTSAGIGDDGNDGITGQALSASIYTPQASTREGGSGAGGQTGTTTGGGGGGGGGAGGSGGIIFVFARNIVNNNTATNTIDVHGGNGGNGGNGETDGAADGGRGGGGAGGSGGVIVICSTTAQGACIPSTYVNIAGGLGGAAATVGYNIPGASAGDLGSSGSYVYMRI